MPAGQTWILDQSVDVKTLGCIVAERERERDSGIFSLLSLLKRFTSMQLKVWYRKCPSLYLPRQSVSLAALCFATLFCLCGQHFVPFHGHVFVFNHRNRGLVILTHATEDWSADHLKSKHHKLNLKPINVYQAATEHQ